MLYLQYQLRHSLKESYKWASEGQIAIFAVICGQNRVCDPTSVNRAAPKLYANNIEDIASRFNLNAFLWLLCVI